MDRYVGHYRRYNLEGIRAKLEEAGITPTSWSYFDFLGYCSAWITIYAGKLFGWKGSLSPASVALYDSAVFPISVLLDRIGFRHLVGKNILIDATKPVKIGEKGN